MDNRISLLLFFTGIFLLFSTACAKHEYALTNANLSPFWQWRSAYECLQNFSRNCSKKDTITMAGVVDVNDAELLDYCGPGGCKDHTLLVLKCIDSVKRDFWFANKATIFHLNKTITNGCTTNTSFTTANFKSSGAKTYQNLVTSLLASTLVVVTILHM